MKRIDHTPKTLRRVKILLIFFAICLIFSGVTAFPIERQLAIAASWTDGSGSQSPLADWIRRTYEGVHETNERFPFIAYGTDWLAFAHLVIALAFIGPIRDPVKNIWVIEFGFIACVAVLPMAFIAGEAREIPIFWRLIDCTFGVAGGLVLSICYYDIKRMETAGIKA